MSNIQQINREFQARTINLGVKVPRSRRIFTLQAGAGIVPSQAGTDSRSFDSSSSRTRQPIGLAGLYTMYVL
jgi:hypothetical protein